MLLLCPLTRLNLGLALLLPALWLNLGRVPRLTLLLALCTNLRRAPYRTLLPTLRRALH